MHRREIDGLDATRSYWVLSVVSPQRDWSAVPGCRRGARFLVDGEGLRASAEDFTAFESQSECLRWVMQHRAELNRSLPSARLKPVLLDRWLLGLD